MDPNRTDPVLAPVTLPVTGASSTLMVGRYGIYISIDFAGQGTLFVSLDDRGGWTMDEGTMEDCELKRILTVFQHQVRTELQHILEHHRAQLQAQKKAQ